MLPTKLTAIASKFSARYRCSGRGNWWKIRCRIKRFDFGILIAYFSKILRFKKKLLKIKKITNRNRRIIGPVCIVLLKGIHSTGLSCYLAPYFNKVNIYLDHIALMPTCQQTFPVVETFLPWKNRRTWLTAIRVSSEAIESIRISCQLLNFGWIFDSILIPCSHRCPEW